MKKILLISTGGTISSQRQNNGLTPITVSYTHLDVYKRQE